MVFDLNPEFGEDSRKANSARKVAEMLRQTSGGDFSKVPSRYLSSMGFEYSDGTVSLLDQLDKVEFSSNSYDEFSEVVDRLIRVDSSDWPDPESIVSIQSEKLLREDDSRYDELDWFFAENKDMSRKIELFMRKLISSVYTDGVTSVSDVKGNPPSAQNNYLMASDGKSFSGIFYDSGEGGTPKKFPFKIKENSKGSWEIVY